MCGCKHWSDDINESNYNMLHNTIHFAVRVPKDYCIWISRENNIIQSDLPDGSTKLCPLHVYLDDVLGTRSCPRARFGLAGLKLVLK